MTGAYIDIWHCDAIGLYSDEPAYNGDHDGYRGKHSPNSWVAIYGTGLAPPTHTATETDLVRGDRSRGSSYGWRNYPRGRRNVSGLYHLRYDESGRYSGDIRHWFRPCDLCGQHWSGVFGSVPDIESGDCEHRGVAAEVLFAGLVGAGLYQINVVVPGGVAPRDQVVIASVSGLSTQANALLKIA